MVLLQDWASDDFLIKPVRPDIADCGHDPSNVTNVRLKALLRTHFGLEFEDIYATNVFPFIKPGGMSGAIKAADFGRAIREFAIPQLEIVAPRLVICLGLMTYNTFARAAGQHAASTIAGAIAQPFGVGSAEVWAQAHTGRLGAARRGTQQMDDDWQHMAAVTTAG